MQPSLRFSQILLLLLILVCVTQAAILEEKFKKLGLGEKIKGTKVSELTVRTNMECYTRYLYPKFF